jgi:hypothetical protein
MPGGAQGNSVGFRGWMQVEPAAVSCADGRPQFDAPLNHAL